MSCLDEARFRADPEKLTTTSAKGKPPGLAVKSRHGSIARHAS